MDEDEYEIPSYVPETAKPRWEAWFRQAKAFENDNGVSWLTKAERDRARMFFFLGWIAKEDIDLVEATKGLN